jgi:hypothetical protein
MTEENSGVELHPEAEAIARFVLKSKLGGERADVPQGTHVLAASAAITVRGIVEAGDDVTRIPAPTAKQLCWVIAQCSEGVSQEILTKLTELADRASEGEVHTVEMGPDSEGLLASTKSRLLAAGVVRPQTSRAKLNLKQCAVAINWSQLETI